MQTTAAWLLDLVSRSGLLPEGTTQQLASEWPNPDGPARDLARELIQRGFLTPFQANLLLQGKYRTFFLFSKYKLLDMLGSGGMGRVYLCEHINLHRLVAVKVLLQQHLKDPSSVERFYREARVIAALEHPNIVRIYDVEPHPTAPLMVMEYIDGIDLETLVSRHGPLSVERACNYLAQAAMGLQYVSYAGLVHRDMKPGNLLLNRDGEVKIVDLGLARFFNRGGAAGADDAVAMGTADYFAPEQALGETVDIRADLYALGGTMFYLLTGQPPFAGRDLPQKLLAHQSEAPPSLHDFRSDIPPELDAIVQRLMAKAREDRFASPQELVEALSPWTQTLIPPPAPEELVRDPLGNGLNNEVRERSSVARRADHPLNLPNTSESDARSKAAAKGPPTILGQSKPIPLWRWIAVGVISAGLFVIVALPVLAPAGPPAPTTPTPTPPALGTSPISLDPSEPLPPDQARFHLGQERIVEFEVVYTGYDNGKTLLFLNSMQEYSRPECFTVVVPRELVGSAPFAGEFEELGKTFTGKRIRVKGPITEYSRNRHPQVVLQSADQVTVLN